MRIRPATSADVPAVAALEADLFGPDAWSAEAVTEELTGRARHAVVAVTEGGSTSNEGRFDVVGYAVVRLGDDVADLHRIGVAPQLRRTGLGHALLDEVRRLAGSEGATTMLLEVSATNATALRFYAAEGFEEIDRRPRYYRDGADALVLCGPVGAPACGGRTR